MPEWAEIKELPVNPGGRMAALEVLANPAAQFRVSVDGHELMDQKLEQLYLEAEGLFFELLRASMLLSGDTASLEDNYTARFHYLFFRFISGQLKPEEIENSEPYASIIKAKHKALIQDAYIGRLYDHCQTRVIAYMLKTKVITSEDEYVSGNYSDVFQVLSTGLLRLAPREKLLSGPPAEQPPVEFPDAAIASTGTSTEVAIALAS